MNKNVTPYKDGSNKKSQIRLMFDRVAGRYDMMNRLMSMGVDIGWRKKLIRDMGKAEPKYILDMATGTGDLAIMAARSIKGSKVLGIDLSPNMIQIAHNKVAGKQLGSHITLRTGDAENLDLDDDQFDAAMIAFGVRNFENLDKGLKELRRVLKPGAVIYILEFSRPTIFPVKQVFNLYFKLVVPAMGKMFSRDAEAYTYLYESVQAFPDYDRMTDAMTSAGFRNCTWEALTFGICCLYKGEK